MKRRFNFTEIAVSDYDKLAVLSKSHLCNGMDRSEMQSVLQYFHSYKIEDGAAIYNEGDEEAFLFLIVSGKVNILKGDNKVISTLVAGETVCEMTIIDQLPRSASAIADTEVVVYAITRTSFNELFNKSVNTWAKFVMNMAVCLSSRLRQTNELLTHYMYKAN
jgi:CRP-like cAMP-binding protein